MSEIIPIGKYTGKARGGGVGETKGGKPQVGVAFELTNGPFAGRRLTWFNLLETVKQEEQAIKALRAAGWRGDDITDLRDLSRPDVPEVELDIEHNEWEGKTSARVKWVNSLIRVNPMKQDKLAALRDRMRSRAIVTATATSAPPPNVDDPPSFDAPSDPEPPPHSDADNPGPGDDDIPF